MGWFDHPYLAMRGRKCHWIFPPVVIGISDQLIANRSQKAIAPVRRRMEVDPPMQLLLKALQQ